MKQVIFFISLTLSVSMQVQPNYSLFKAILKNDTIIDYLHPELQNRKVLYLIKNDYWNINEKIGELTVKTVDESKVKKNKNYLKFTSRKNKGNIRILTFDYPIEGAVFIIQANKKNEIIKVDVLEK